MQRGLLPGPGIEKFLLKTLPLSPKPDKLKTPHPDPPYSMDMLFACGRLSILSKTLRETRTPDTRFKVKAIQG